MVCSGFLGRVSPLKYEAPPGDRGLLREILPQGLRCSHVETPPPQFGSFPWRVWLGLSIHPAWEAGRVSRESHKDLISQRQTPPPAWCWFLPSFPRKVHGSTAVLSLSPPVAVGSGVRASFPAGPPENSRLAERLANRPAFLLEREPTFNPREG